MARSSDDDDVVGSSPAVVNGAGARGGLLQWRQRQRTRPKLSTSGLVLSSSEEEDDGSDVDATPERQPSLPDKVLISDSDDDDEPAPTAAPAAAVASTSTPNLTQHRAPVTAIESSSDDDNDDSDDDDEGSPAVAQSPEFYATPGSVSQNDVDDDVGDDSPVAVRRRAGRAPRRVLSDSEGEEEESADIGAREKGDGRESEVSWSEESSDDDEEFLDATEEVASTPPPATRQDDKVISLISDEDEASADRPPDCVDEFISEDDGESEESDDDDDSEDENDSEDEDEVQIIDDDDSPRVAAKDHEKKGPSDSPAASASSSSPPRRRSYTREEVRALESQVATQQRVLESNRNLWSRQKRVLPDGGSKLLAHIAKLETEHDETRRRMREARENVLKPGEAPEPEPELVPEERNYLQLEQRLGILRQQARVVKPGSTADGGAELRKQISAAQMELMRAEVDLRRKRPDFFRRRQQQQQQQQQKSGPVGKQAAMLGQAMPASNSAWQQFRGNLGSAANKVFGDEKLWAQGPASNALYGGRMNADRRQEVVTVTQAALKKLHASLETMPSEADEEVDPKGLKSSIQLFPHQRQSLAWLLWRETQDPPGGILADDMGLGKTLTMIALLLKSREVEEEQKAKTGAVQPGEKGEEQKENWWSKLDKTLVRSRGTLIVCPASLICQWEGEVEKRLKSGVLKVCVYHGNNRSKTARSLAKYDLVVTTYGTVLSEMKGVLAKEEGKGKLEDLGPMNNDKMETKNVQLLSVAWDRIILDEAHQIRNPRSQTALAVCRLRAARRWAVSGTPIQNKELDMYSLIRFLRCSPFDEYRVWKLWVDNKTSQGLARMNTLVRSLLLRRTKDQTSLKTGKAIVELPEKTTEEHEIALTEQERRVYDEVFSFSQQAMMNYMSKHNKDKQKDDLDYMAHVNRHGTGRGFHGAAGEAEVDQSGGGDGAAGKSKITIGGGGKDVKAHHLLVLLLRLRQICCHPGLIKSMIDAESRANDGLADSDGEEADLISQMADMSLAASSAASASSDAVEKTFLRADNPVFKESLESSKIRTVVDELKKLKAKPGSGEDVEKAVIVSQWTSMLHIVRVHVESIGLRCTAINGQVPVKDRGDIVTAFNRRKAGGPQVMLLSLAAGGVGLNLTGANHLFLLDMHWNPQLEKQACDRIYRVGQTRPVKIHRFLCQETVEARILQLQQAKLDLAQDVLSGAKSAGQNKLSFDDLKMLFNVH